VPNAVKDTAGDPLTNEWIQLIGDLLRARAPISSMASILKVRLSRMRNEDVRAMFFFFFLSSSLRQESVACREGAHKSRMRRLWRLFAMTQ
jgi:hypothetical protein